MWGDILLASVVFVASGMTPWAAVWAACVAPRLIGGAGYSTAVIWAATCATYVLHGLLVETLPGAPLRPRRRRSRGRHRVARDPQPGEHRGSERRAPSRARERARGGVLPSRGGGEQRAHLRPRAQAAARAAPVPLSRIHHTRARRSRRRTAGSWRCGWPTWRPSRSRSTSSGLRRG